jgi:hypothetical protein
MTDEKSGYRRKKDLAILRLGTVHKTRKENFHRLATCGLFDSIVALSVAIGQAPGVYYAICGDKAYKNMGEALARDIEVRLKLPAGWLDQKH